MAVASVGVTVGAHARELEAGTALSRPETSASADAGGNFRGGRGALIESLFSSVKHELSAPPPGRTLRMQVRQALLLGLSFNLYRLEASSPFPEDATENGFVESSVQMCIWRGVSALAAFRRISTCLCNQVYGPNVQWSGI